MNHRQRFIATILGEPVDRPIYWLAWSPWARTWRRWEAEGKPAWVTDHRAFMDPDPEPQTLPVNCGPYPPELGRVIAEDENYIVFIDSWGIRRRDYKLGESMSEFLDFPVKNRAGWIEFRDRWLNPDDPRRLEGKWREQGRAWMEQGIPIRLGNYPDVGIFGTFRWLLGDEEGLVAFHTDPALVHEIMDHMTSLYLTVFTQVVREVEVDNIHLWEDMCYRGGPLISPRMWEEFMGPCYRRIKAFADQHNIPVISVDTDGDPDRITPAMMRAGMNLLFPMEVAAGCDVNQWQKRYPSLAMMGGIDKRALAQGKEAIDRELERIRPALGRGRYIPDLDHLVPDDVSWENYCYYAARLKSMVGKV